MSYNPSNTKAPERLDYASMTGQHDAFIVMTISGDSAVTTRVDVVLATEWVAVYVGADLVAAFDSFTDSGYTDAIRFAADLHILEVAAL